MDNWINAKDSSVTKYLTFDNMSGWGWSIGESISCGTGWQVFSGSVNLGGSYSWNSYQSQETIYTIIVDSGRVINLYYNGGGVITYQNRYWAADSWGGVLSGSGTSQWVENARGLINYNIAEIYCPNYGDAAYLSVQLNSDEATGDIYIYGREPDGYINGHVYTYGCDDGINWQYIDDVYVTGVGGYQYFYMGTNPGYRYLCFAGYYHSGCSLCFQIDAVFVV